jgi:hypothetical protein
MRSAMAYLSRGTSAKAPTTGAITRLFWPHSLSYTWNDPVSPGAVPCSRSSSPAFLWYFPLTSCCRLETISHTVPERSAGYLSHTTWSSRKQAASTRALSVLRRHFWRNQVQVRRCTTTCPFACFCRFCCYCCCCCCSRAYSSSSLPPDYIWNWPHERGPSALSPISLHASPITSPEDSVSM